MDERKLRIYAFLLKLGRIMLEEIPDPYKTELAVL